jgi:D-serine deaminase-like pyridoxal phosphate-dependent protein
MAVNPLKRDDLDTPALTIDLEVMADNIHRLQAYCDRHGLANRPHIKTHKIPAIAHQQLTAGAVGITCQKLGEAEVMVAAGIRDVFIPYNLLGPAKLARLVRLCRQAKMSVACDSATTAQGLSEAMTTAGLALPVLIEVESEHHRAGVTSAQAAVALAHEIDRLPGLIFGGLMIYPSGSESAPFLAEVIDALQRAGLPPQVVSGGGTPQAYRCHQVAGLTEIRVGTYVFNDWTVVRGGWCTPEQCALKVLVTVVSAPTADRVLIDGGSKTFTNDGQFPMGHIIEYPEAQVYRLHEEHGFVDVSRCPRRPKVGERLTVIPNHACGTTNLHDVAHGLLGDTVEVTWKIEARGKVQ